jgi:serine phosphatase RsbU (regulator of sigma subunit)
MNTLEISRTHSLKDWPKDVLVNELLHVQEVASLALPRKDRFPTLANIDYFAEIDPYMGCVGGDLLTIVNFDEYHLDERIELAETAGDHAVAARLRKNKNRFGIMVADAAGHSIGDSVTVNYLHGAFKTGVAYELKHNGEVTADLFELLNTQFYNRMSPEYLARKPYLTLLYGEVSNDGVFRFLSAGHPPPIVFSNEYDRIVKLDTKDVMNSTPLGIFPSEYHVDIEHFDPSGFEKGKYPLNEIALLGKGDILLLYTDGLIDQEHSPVSFSDERLEQVLRETKHESARDVHAAIKAALHSYGEVTDDVTLAVIKKR